MDSIEVYLDMKSYGLQTDVAEIGVPWAAP